MSDKCGNCDCADKTQYVKKGNSYGIVMVDTEKSHFEVQEFAENDGKSSASAAPAAPAPTAAAATEDAPASS